MTRSAAVALASTLLLSSLRPTRPRSGRCSAARLGAAAGVGIAAIAGGPILASALIGGAAGVLGGAFTDDGQVNLGRPGLEEVGGGSRGPSARHAGRGADARRARASLADDIGFAVLTLRSAPRWASGRARLPSPRRRRRGPRAVDLVDRDVSRRAPPSTASARRRILTRGIVFVRVHRGTPGTFSRLGTIARDHRPRRRAPPSRGRRPLLAINVFLSDRHCSLLSSRLNVPAMLPSRRRSNKGRIEAASGRSVRERREQRAQRRVERVRGSRRLGERDDRLVARVSLGSRDRLALLELCDRVRPGPARRCRRAAARRAGRCCVAGPAGRHPRDDRGRRAEVGGTAIPWLSPTLPSPRVVRRRRLRSAL